MNNKKILVTILLFFRLVWPSDNATLAGNSQSDLNPETRISRSCDELATDWEDLTLSTTYVVGDVFATYGTTVTAHPFEWTSGTLTYAGYTAVQNGGLANGSGLEMMVNNINLQIDPGVPATYMEILFGEYGGNLNFEINGDFHNFQNFQNIDGLTIGGVDVVVTGGFGNDAGILYLTANMQDVHHLMIGGQELWIDDICYDGEDDPPPPPPGDCEELATDWEDLSLSAMYNVGDVFTTYSTTVTAQPFVWSSGTPTSAGYTQVQNGGLANGSGQEMMVNNINLEINIGVAASYMEVLFGEYGGNLNLEINGSFQNFENFQDVHGMTIGGVDVTVMGGLGNDAGTLYLTANTQDITHFVIGGQELWIDDICYDESGELPPPPPAGCEELATDWEDQTLGATYYVGDHLTTYDVEVDVLSFELSDGTIYTAGNTMVADDGSSNGTGLRMIVNNVNLDFDFGSPTTYIEILFGEHGGNKNIKINNDFRNFEDFSEIDGQIIGGVEVTVIGGYGWNAGTLILHAHGSLIHHLFLGGQQFSIDDICITRPDDPPPPPPGDCEELATDWEDLSLSAMYNVGDVFTTYSTTVTAQPFVWSSGTPTSAGYTQVQNGGLANGSGQEMMVNNINLEIDPGYVATHMEVLFGEYGGNLNLEINGDFRNFENFQDINGLVVGGVDVSVTGGYGNDYGVLTLSSNVNDVMHFVIGGQELWIDDICFDGYAIEPEVEPGDVDGSGTIDVIDVVTTISFILGSLVPSDAQQAAADLNGDGSLDVIDVVMLVALILGDGGMNRAESLQGVNIRVNDSSLELLIDGCAAGIQIETDGDYSVSATHLENGCQIHQGNNSVLIICVDGQEIPSGTLIDYEGSLEVLNGIAANLAGDSVNITVDNMPGQFKLSAAYPNPFNPVTTLSYDLTEYSQVRIDIYDINGRLVETLMNNSQGAGQYTVTWNASAQATGVFFARLTSGQNSQVQKLFLIK